MKLPILFSAICLAIFIGLLQGTHYFYIANADTEMGIYMTAVLVILMWMSLFGVFISLAFPKLKKIFKGVF